MNSLDVTRINIYAPYKVWSNGEIYRFETDNGIKYLVDFELVVRPRAQCPRHPRRRPTALLSAHQRTDRRPDRVATALRRQPPRQQARLRQERHGGPLDLWSLLLPTGRKNHLYQTARDWTWARLIEDGKALLAIDPDQPTRILSTDKKAQKAGGLCLALKGVPVKPTDDVDVDKEYQLIPLDSL